MKTAATYGAAIAFLVAASFAFADTGATSSSTAVDLVGLLREFGFPIFVSVWFMWRLEKRMDRLTGSIEQLTTTVTIMARTMEDLPAGPVGPPGPPGPQGTPGPAGAARGR